MQQCISQPMSRPAPAPLPSAAPNPAAPKQVAALGAGNIMTVAVLGVLSILALGAQRAIAQDERTRLLFGIVSLISVFLGALKLVTSIRHNVDGIAHWRVGPWYLLWGTFAFGVASLTWLGSSPDQDRQIELSSVTSALLLLEVAVLVWTFAYLMGPPQAIIDAAANGLRFLWSGTTTSIRGGAMPIVLYGFGSMARLAAYLTSGRFGYVGDPSAAVSQAGPYTHMLDLLSTTATFGIAGAAYRSYSNKSLANSATLWTIASIEFAVGALSGTKESFIVCIIAILVPFGARRGRISIRVITVGAVLLLGIIVPFNTAYRSQVRRSSSTLTTSAAFEAAPDTFSSIVDNWTSNTVLDSTESLLYRIRLVDNVAIIMQLTPSTIEFRSPVEYASAPLIGAIPRAIWPNKPIDTTGYTFSQEYYGHGSTLYTSAATTAPGDLYRHGGWLTLVIGMALLGLFCRLFDTLIQPETNARAIYFLIAFLPMLVKSETDISGMIMNIPSSIIIATIGAHLVFRRTSGSQRYRP